MVISAGGFGTSGFGMVVQVGVVLTELQVCRFRGVGLDAVEEGDILVGRSISTHCCGETRRVIRIGREYS